METRQEIPADLDAAIHAAIVDLDMIGSWRDPVTGYELTMIDARCIALCAMRALNRAWERVAAPP